MGKLTTHVLDTSTGKPASAMCIDFAVVEAGGPRLLSSVETNADGRTDEPLLAGEALSAGVYELVFSLGDYFAALGRANAPIPFLGEVPIRFGVADADANYHVPLLASPWAYSTYRGS